MLFGDGRMHRRTFLATLATTFSAKAAFAERVSVVGSQIRFENEIEREIRRQRQTYRLTGTALREYGWFNVYALGSYLATGQSANSAQELASIDAPKCLHLVLERDVSGADMSKAMSTMITANHHHEFSDEKQRLESFIRTRPVRRGENVWITHVKGEGTEVAIANDTPLFIANPRFSVAIWNIYLGPRNLGENIKRGLVSRL